MLLLLRTGMPPVVVSGALRLPRRLLPPSGKRRTCSSVGSLASKVAKSALRAYPGGTESCFAVVNIPHFFSSLLFPPYLTGFRHLAG
jgi:hypothetical protein